MYLHNGGTVYESISGYTTDESLVSILGRLSYNYQNKYFLEGSFRRDGSSRFAQDKMGELLFSRWSMGSF